TNYDLYVSITSALVTLRDIASLVTLLLFLLLRPPASTLFPYTTLFRSLMRCEPLATGLRLAVADGAEHLRTLGVAVIRRRTSARSEEHTSELQSRVDLVCRLLLEKKKTTAT